MPGVIVPARVQPASVAAGLGVRVDDVLLRLPMGDPQSNRIDVIAERSGEVRAFIGEPVSIAEPPRPPRGWTVIAFLHVPVACAGICHSMIDVPRSAADGRDLLNLWRREGPTTPHSGPDACWGCGLAPEPDSRLCQWCDELNEYRQEASRA